MVYTFQGKTYPKRVGTREEVYAGIAFSTGKGANSLIKEDLVLHEGLYITVRQYNAAQKKEGKKNSVKEMASVRTKKTPKVGTRHQVVAGEAMMTAGRLHREDLRIVGGTIYTQRELEAAGLADPGPLPPLPQVPSPADVKRSKHLPPPIPEEFDLKGVPSLQAFQSMENTMYNNWGNGQFPPAEIPQIERPRAPSPEEGSSSSSPPTLTPPWREPQMETDLVKDMSYFITRSAELEPEDPVLGLTVTFGGKLYLMSAQVLQLDPSGTD